MKCVGGTNYVAEGQGIDAKSQFIAFASASSFVHRPSSPSQSSSSTCFVGLLPPSVIVEFLGKGWILRPERNILLTFSHPSDQPDTHVSSKKHVFFSVSHTLGIIVHPLPVSIPPFFSGWIGGNNSVVQHQVGPPGTDDYGVSVMDTSSEQLTTLLLSGVRIGSTILCCCNTRWIVVITGDSGHEKLHVWRVVDSVPQIPEKVFDCPWIEHSPGVRFYGRSEYSEDSDIIELMWTQQKQPSGQYMACILHVDLVAVMQYGSIPNGNMIECTNKAQSRFMTLPNALVQRPGLQYYFPFSSPLKGKMRTQQLLHMNTGDIITWLDESPTSASRVDDTHLAITDNSHTTTTVFTPLFIVGCGLIIADSSSHPLSTGGKTKGRAIIKKGDTSPQYTLHTITDATTGALLLTLCHNDTTSVTTCAVETLPFSFHLHFT
ncbi:hypothetical protein Pelo_10261 [Pelomyxa schiedti]|nr:hypothetical protein Pelo_10261 [Pelomyxa schiedti]